MASVWPLPHQEVLEPTRTTTSEHIKPTIGSSVFFIHGLLKPLLKHQTAGSITGIYLFPPAPPCLPKTRISNCNLGSRNFHLNRPDVCPPSIHFGNSIHTQASSSFHLLFEHQVSTKTIKQESSFRNKPVTERACECPAGRAGSRGRERVGEEVGVGERRGAVGAACPSERPIQGTYSYYLRVIYE